MFSFPTLSLTPYNHIEEPSVESLIWIGEELVFTEPNEIPYIAIYIGKLSRHYIPIPVDAYRGPPREYMPDSFSHSYELGDYLMVIWKKDDKLILIGETHGHIELNAESNKNAIKLFNAIIELIER